MSKIKEHYPVMNREIVDIFTQNKCETFIDCTLGMGGHVRALLNSHKSRNLKVIACDCDADSLNIAREKLNEFNFQVDYILSNFKNIFEKANLKTIVNGLVLVDPGLSMYQIKSGLKGYSFSIDSKLDMRKDEELKISAKEVVNHYSHKELKEIFLKYGEVKKSAELAQRIIEVRLSGEIESSKDLSEIIEKVYNWKPKRGKLHPAAQVFQALRIYVNHELEDLEAFLKQIRQLQSDMLIVVLTYHSLEDRIVKRSMKDLEREGICRRIKPFPMNPSGLEIATNPASRSAKLRAVKTI